MGVLDILGEADPSVADVVGSLDAVLRRSRADPEIDSWITRSSRLVQSGQLSDAASSFLASPETPPAGIFGVGGSWDRGVLRPTVFVAPPLGMLGSGLDEWGAAVPLEDSPAGDILRALGGPRPVGVMAVSLPLPALQAAPSGRAVCQSIQSTLGIAVPGQPAPGVPNPQAILSAGHGVRPIGKAVSDGKSQIGVVRLTSALEDHGAGTDVADVAVIDLGAGVVLSGGPPMNQTGTAQQHAAVVAHGQAGAQTGWIRAMVPSFALQTNWGSWGEVLLTDTGISYGGDSGAPVLLDDGLGTVIGQIVAGAPPAYSLIQDVDYLLKATGCVFVPSK